MNLTQLQYPFLFIVPSMRFFKISIMNLLGYMAVKSYVHMYCAQCTIVAPAKLGTYNLSVRLIYAFTFTLYRLSMQYKSFIVHISLVHRSFVY